MGKQGSAEDIRGSNSDEVQIAKESSVDRVSEFLLDLDGNKVHEGVEEYVEGRNQNDSSQKSTENNSNYYYKSDKASEVYTKFEKSNLQPSTNTIKKHWNACNVCH